MRVLIAGLLILQLFGSCAKLPIEKKGGRGPASSAVSAVTINPVMNLNTTVSLSVTPVKVCNITFSRLEMKSSNSLFVTENVLITRPEFLGYNLQLPSHFRFVDASSLLSSSNLVVIKSGSGSNLQSGLPLLPDLPIVPEGLNNKECQRLKKYADAFKKMSGVSLNESEFLAVTVKGGVLSSTMKANLGNLANTRINQERQRFLATDLWTLPVPKNEQGIAGKTTSINIPFLIIYQDEYEVEVENIADFYNNRGIPTHIVRVTDLPGYDALAPTPTECNGVYYNECYHTWGTAINGVSQLAVPSLKGFHRQTKIWEQYQRVSYIPGLVRAYIRAFKKTNSLRGAMLVGNNDVLAPHFTTTVSYHDSGLPSNFRRSHLHTDLYNMIPDATLTVSNDLHYSQIQTNYWSCRNNSTQVVTLRKWCNDDEGRDWPTPALTAYRWQPYFPLARIFVGPTTNQSSVARKDIIPVGRIVTQERIEGGYDPVVSNYYQKLQRWESELPSMVNSIASHGGSTADYWIYTLDDTLQFKSTYGQSSHVYASQFFVPLSNCPGCTYKTADQIVTELSGKNHSAILMNGHGGNSGVQGPYGNGDVPSGYSAEYHYRIWGDLKRTLLAYPGVNTFKLVENQERLIGHVIANSCSVSNFNAIDNDLNFMFKALDSNANQRSFAEQLIAMPDSGALNTYLNSDVGWGGSDNAYNVKFMYHVKAAWNGCGVIGDALRNTIYDMTHGQYGGAGSWQLVNRVFFGSPMNSVAKAAPQCIKVKWDPNDDSPL